MPVHDGCRHSPAPSRASALTLLRVASRPASDGTTHLQTDSDIYKQDSKRPSDFPAEVEAIKRLNVDKGYFHIGFSIKIEVNLNQGIIAIPLPSDLDIRIPDRIAERPPEILAFRQQCDKWTCRVNHDPVITHLLKDPLIFGQCIYVGDVAVLLNRNSYVEQYD